MTTLHASWVHGSAVQPEREGYHVSKRRSATGATFNTVGQEWFHFAIPTPVIVGGERTKVKKAFVLYETKGTALITDVMIHDGTAEIAAFKKLSLKGTHDDVIDAQNSWTFGPKAVKYGVGISVCVDFGPPSKAGVPGVTFTSAGADFETS